MPKKSTPIQCATLGIVSGKLKVNYDNAAYSTTETETPRQKNHIYLDLPKRLKTDRNCGTYLGLRLIGEEYPEEDNNEEAEAIAQQRITKQLQTQQRLAKQAWLESNGNK